MTETPRLVRAALASNRIMTKVLAGVRSVHSGIWLGLMDNDTMDTATTAFYETEDYYLERDNNTSGLYSWERDTLAKHRPPPARCLVPASGAGREILAMDAMGYDATGYDPSEPLVALGNDLITEAGSGATLLLSSGTGPPPDLDPGFDLVLFGWGGISHIRGRDERIRVVQQLVELLDDDGLFMASFLARDPALKTFPLTYQVAVTIRSLRRSADTVELGDLINGSFDHYFTMDAIAKEFAEAGLTEVERITDPFPHMVCRKT